MITKVSNNDLTAVNAAPVALVDFSATWCGPCKMLAPIVDELEGKVQVFSVDIDENPALAQKFRIEGVPTLVLLKDGKLASQSVGFKPKPMVSQWISENL